MKQEAKKHGFDFCGIAKAEFLDEDARRLESWLANNYQGGMGYMENYFDLRTNPALLVPGAKSVITLLKNYYPQGSEEPSLKISKYALGEDYHEVIKSQLRLLVADLKQALGNFDGRGFVDSAPVLERAWAVKSGLGWIGKNGNLITKGQGSFFFIATLITDLNLEPDDAFAKDYCGSCNRCVEACPTSAILPDKTINGSQCISYFTIELKEEALPNEMQGKFQNWAFGCDTCQDVCPWNRFSKPTTEQRFAPLSEMLELSTEEWEAMSEESFRRVFKNSPIKRSKHKGLQRNIRFIKTHHS